MIRIDDIVLRPLSEGCLNKLYEWRNDPELYRYFRQFRMLTWKEHKQWFDNLDSNRELMYGIYCDDDSIRKSFPARGDEIFNIPSFGSDGLIGCAGLCNLNWHNRSAELSLYIGNKDQTNRSEYYISALKILEYILFIELNFHKLWAEVYEGNPILTFLKRQGYKEDGIIRDSSFMYDDYINGIILSKLEEEYEGIEVESGKICLI